MRKKLLSIIALTILIASALIGCSQASSTPSTLTILSITDGDVFVMKAGTDDWIETEVGISLEVGDSIKTSDDSSAEITFFDGSTIELEAGTEIEVVSLDISSDTGSTTITLEQTIGTTISRVTKLIDPASSYEIETPTGVAAVRGSTMIVTVGGDGTTWTTNQEGNIWFIGQGLELQVPEGQTCLSISGELPELISLAQDDTAITDEDNPVTVDAPGVLNNDSDPNVGDNLTVTSVDTSGTVGAVTAWNADGSFSYDPNGQFEYLQAGSSTTDSYTYTVSNSNGGTDTATVTVTINGVNDIPTDINLDNSSVAEDQYYGTVVGNFSTTDPDTGDTFNYSLVSGEGDDNNTSFMIIDSQLQTINSFDYETRNYCSIRVRSTDSGMLYYEESFIITVTNVNEPPVNYPAMAVDDAAITDEDNPVTVAVPGVLNNDSDPDVGDTLIVTSVDTNGTVGTVTTWNTDGSFTYDPNGQFEYLQAGGSTTDSFTYTVSDSNGGTDTATVTITINGVNDPPVAVDDSDTTPGDTPITIDVLNNDVDSDGDTLIVDSVTQGTHGSVTYNAANVTYTPSSNFTGTDSFTYTISDGNGGTDTASITITVTIIETLARINVQIDTGPTASIYIRDNTIGGWATDEDTGDPVDGTKHVTSDTIKVTGGHSYCVWVGAANVTYDVKSYPSDWSQTSAPNGGEAACGKAAAGIMHPVHFTQSTPS